MKKGLDQVKYRVIQMAAASYEEDVLIAACKIFEDNWTQLAHYNDTPEGKLYHEGRLYKEDTVEMLQMMVEHLGRKNDEEFIF